MVSIEKPTVLSLMKTIPSGIGLDVSKNHTGVVIWNGETIETYGFALSDYDETDYFAEYKMRREFKGKLKEIVNGRHFEYCIIEDVYGGENFSTVRKLLALNTVIDELIFERVCTIGNFFRWNEPEWMSSARMIYKQKGKLKVKIEIQEMLKYLEFEFALKNWDLSESEKKDIFFEDICDACGMLLAVIARKNFDVAMVKSKRLNASDLRVKYFDCIEDAYVSKEGRILEEGFYMVDLDNYRGIEKKLIDYISIYPNDVLCCMIPPDKLGSFGMKYNIDFSPEDEGYLIFYNKAVASKSRK